MQHNTACEHVYLCIAHTGSTVIMHVVQSGIIAPTVQKFILCAAHVVVIRLSNLTAAGMSSMSH